MCVLYKFDYLCLRARLFYTQKKIDSAILGLLLTNCVCAPPTTTPIPFFLALSSVSAQYPRLPVFPTTQQQNKYFQLQRSGQGCRF